MNRKVYIIVYDAHPHMQMWSLFNIIEVVESDENRWLEDATNIQRRHQSSQNLYHVQTISFFAPPEDVLKQYMKSDAWE